MNSEPNIQTMSLGYLNFTIATKSFAKSEAKKLVLVKIYYCGSGDFLPISKNSDLKRKNLMTAQIWWPWKKKLQTQFKKGVKVELGFWMPNMKFKY